MTWKRGGVKPITNVNLVLWNITFLTPQIDIRIHHPHINDYIMQAKTNAKKFLEGKTSIEKSIIGLLRA